jgi:hypothetical protein
MVTLRHNEFMVPRSRLVAVIAACGVAIGLPILAAAAPAAATTPAARPVGAVAAASGHVTPGLAALTDRAALLQRAALLAHSASITGVVVGPYGLPVPGACVSADGPAGRTISTASPEGRFDITGLAPGSYVLAYGDCSDPAGYLPIWSGGGMSQRTAAHIQTAAGSVSHVPAMMLRPANPATMLPDGPAWRRMLAASSATLSAAAAARTGKITGKVTGNGKPLRGICVHAWSASARAAPNYGAATNNDGTYLIRHVRPGRYWVSFAQDCATSGNWLEQWYRGHNTPVGLNANTVKITAGKTKHINARLTLGGELSGRVTTKSGKGLRGICIFAVAFLSQFPVPLFAATGKDGKYRLRGLFPAKYTASFSTGCDNHGNYAASADFAFRIRHTQHRTLNVRLAVGAIVTGTVRLGSSSGRRLKGICVFAENQDAYGSSQGTSGAGGGYRVTSLDTGEVTLYFESGCGNNGNYFQAAVYARATQGKVTRGVNAVMQRAAGIHGKVTDAAGTGLGGMCVNFTGPLPPVLFIATSKNGSYDIEQLPPGSYELGFSNGCSNGANYAPYWYDNQEDQSLATPIVVAKASSHVINARMRLGGEITGTVTDRHGKKLSGICVGITTQFYAAYGLYYDIVRSYRGHFRAGGLEPGQYLVDLGCGLSGYGDQWWRDVPAAGDAELVSVTTGKTSSISAVLQPAGTIRGVVTGGAGLPLSGVCAQAFDSKIRGQALMVFGGSDVAVTNSHGAYQITGLGAGTYHVYFFPCEMHEGYAAQWYRDKATQAPATPVRVRVGVITADVNARLTAGGSISGRVVDAAGKPLTDVCVSGYDPANGVFPFITAVTSKTGRYTVPGVGTGSYAVEFTPCYQAANLVTVFDHVKVTAPKAVTGVDARLVPGGSVSGEITTAGHPALGVGFECAEVESANPDNAGGVGLSEPGGSYLATGIAPGTYKVYFGDQYCGYGAPDLVPQWYDNQASQARATTITVAAGHTAKGIDAALQTDGAIAGAVRDSAGSPVSGVCITAYPSAAGSFPIVAVSRRGGDYSLIDLLPGRYRVKFSSGCGATGYQTQWWHDASSARQATVITVTAEHVTTGISATLTR